MAEFGAQIHLKKHDTDTNQSTASVFENSCMKRLDTQYAGRELNEQETEACFNCLRHSNHTRMRIMPNHHIDECGNLQGFCFTSSPEDKASVLPMSQQMFSCTAVYEVKGESNVNFNADAMRIISHPEVSKGIMLQMVDDMKKTNIRPAMFDCIADLEDFEEGFVLPKIEDQRAWTESVPYKMGVYHAFSRSYANDQREHRIFIIVSGALIEAAEQLYNLWLDCSSQITCREFVESEEARWLRSATLRSLNRVAAKIAKKFDLVVQMVTDNEDPNKGLMALPSLITRHNDMDIQQGQVRMSSASAFTDKTDSGVLFDLFSSEGMWIFLGPRNTTQYGVFGSMLAHRVDTHTFPTRTIRYNNLFPVASSNTVRVRGESNSNVVIHEGLESALVLSCNSSLYNEFMIPDEKFYRIAECLGFNRNDGTMILMPIVCYVTDETFRTGSES